MPARSAASISARPTSVGPGGWWSWALAGVIAALVPAGTWSGVSFAGIPALTVSASVCLLLMVALWWDELSPRLTWNADGFAARGPRGLFYGTWRDVNSVFVAKGRAGDRIVLVTPGGRYDVVLDRLWWLSGQRGRAMTEEAIAQIRAFRAARTVPALPPGGEPPQMLSPLALFLILFGLWFAGLLISLPMA